MMLTVHLAKRLAGTSHNIVGSSSTEKGIGKDHKLTFGAMFPHRTCRAVLLLNCHMGKLFSQVFSRAFFFFC